MTHLIHSILFYYLGITPRSEYGDGLAFVLILQGPSLLGAAIRGVFGGAGHFDELALN